MTKANRTTKNTRPQQRGAKKKDGSLIMPVLL
jgi:hypothetical protein